MGLSKPQLRPHLLQVGCEHLPLVSCWHTFSVFTHEVIYVSLKEFNFFFIPCFSLALPFPELSFVFLPVYSICKWELWKCGSINIMLRKSRNIFSLVFQHRRLGKKAALLISVWLIHSKVPSCTRSKPSPHLLAAWIIQISWMHSGCINYHCLQGSRNMESDLAFYSGISLVQTP